MYSEASKDSVIKLIINIICTNEWSNEIYKGWLNILRSNDKDFFIIFASKFTVEYVSTFTLSILIIIPGMF